MFPSWPGTQGAKPRSQTVNGGVGATQHGCFRSLRFGSLVRGELNSSDAPLIFWTSMMIGGRERYTGFRSGEMNDEVQDLLNAGYKPVVVGP